MAIIPDKKESKARVFIVDDTIDNVDVLRNILEPENYNVSFAESGEEALELIPELIPDIILLDVMMPGIDGYETCRRLKKKDAIRNVPIIFITAKTEAEDILEAIRADGSDYIAKPIKREEVLIRIHHHLKQATLLKVVSESEKLASLGRIVANIAHELNTPIGNSYLSSLEFIDQTDKLNTSFVNNTLGKTQLANYIELSGKVAKMLVTNLEKAALLIKSFKSIATKQAREKPMHFNLKALIDDVIVTMTPIVNKKNITINAICDSNINMFSYPGMLAHIFMNLINNSIIHGFSNRDTGVISIKGEIKNNTVEIEFADDGVGITENIIDKIFTPFFTTKLGEGGTGLGLNIVYNDISKFLGGTIICHNTHGKGAKFILGMPLEIAVNE